MFDNSTYSILLTLPSLYLLTGSSCSQANNKFWKKRIKKSADPPPEPADEPGDDETGANEPGADESEVELDSLGRIFIELADASTSQGHTEGSRAGNVEVISICSGSETFVPKRLRRAVKIIPFSHPDAYLDPNFLSKKS